ncbi:OsmC family protein [candidate division KSB1 bacterium]|nr:OsmC family protein [candidate division KSB1 bacterium]
MKTRIKWIEGLALAGKGESNHWITMDAGEEVGGSDAGTRPLEIFLLGLGGCTSMDVISILKKKRVPLDDFELEIEADRAAEHPKVFTKIRLKFIFYGTGIKEQDVERAIELSETKYCSASAMLRKASEISVEREIREKKS